jgi:hypothetical protein
MLPSYDDQVIVCRAITAPSVTNDTFKDMSPNGTFYYPLGSDYSIWIEKLTALNWQCKPLYEPQTYYNMTITADNVSGRQTNTTIHWTCMTNGYDTIRNEYVEGIEMSGEAVSSPFEQNLSTTDSIERTITFEFNENTATASFTQGVWEDVNYNVVLNDQWRKSETVPSPDTMTFDCVYESFSNKGKEYSSATMYIDINNLTSFRMYIRTNSEYAKDYLHISELDENAQLHTSKVSLSGNIQPTNLDAYTLVEFNDIDGGQHRITVKYEKDNFNHNDTKNDCAYVIIPKQ